MSNKRWQSRIYLTDELHSRLMDYADEHGMETIARAIKTIVYKYLDALDMARDFREEIKRGEQS